MATVDFELLDQALADGMIGLHRQPKKYLTRSVNHLNRLIDIVEEEPGLDLEQIAQRTELSYSSVKCYCQWAKSRGVLTFSEEGKIHIHFPGRIPKSISA